MRHLTKQHAFTLIELIIVIVLMGLLASVAARILAEGLRSLLTARQLTEANWQGQLAVERMLRDLRSVRSANDISISTANEFAFTNMDGNTVDYKLTGSSLMQGSNVLADGINTLTFTYYNQNGTSGATGTAIHYVKASLNVTQNNTNYTISISAYLRDLSS